MSGRLGRASARATAVVLLAAVVSCRGAGAAPRQSLVAVSPTGKRIFTTDVGGGVPTNPSGSAAIAVVTGPSRYVGIDPVTGRQRWTHAGNGSSPAVVAGQVAYVGGGREPVLALDATSGTIRWSTSAIDSVSAADDDIAVGVSKPPDVSAPVLLPPGLPTGPDLDELVAVAVSDGRTRWSTPLPRGSYPGARIVGDVVVSSDVDGVVRGLGRIDGVEKWRVQLGSGPSRSVVASSTAVVFVLGAELVALDGVSGRTAWRASGAGAFDSIVATGGVVVTAGGAGTTAYDAATGVRRWHVDAPTRDVHAVLEPPTVVTLDERRSTLTSLDLFSGDPLWTLQLAADDPDVAIGPTGATVSGPLVFAVGYDLPAYWD